MKFKENILKRSDDLINEILINIDQLYKERFFKNKIKFLKLEDEIKFLNSEERLIKLKFILKFTNSRSRRLFYINNNINNILFLYNPREDFAGLSNFDDNSISLNLAMINSLEELQSVIIHELSHLNDEYNKFYDFNDYDSSNNFSYFTHPSELFPWLMEIWFFQKVHQSSFDDSFNNTLKYFCDVDLLEKIKNYYLREINSNPFLKENFKCLLEK